MSLISKLGGGVFLTGAALMLGAFSSYHSTDSTEVGVRTRKIALFDNPGVEEKNYEPGSTFFFLPIINEWSTYDTKLHIVEMKAGNEEGKPKDLAFKTKEGNDINQDVVFTYRIDPKKASYIRQFVAKDDKELEEKVFNTVARSRTRDYFGELTTQQYYNAVERTKISEKAKIGLQEILGKYGVIVENVGLMDYRFHRDYTTMIGEKKLAEANTSQIRAQITAQKEMNKKLLNDADGEVNKMTAEVNGSYTTTTAAADSYYEQQQAAAKAILKKAENDALVIKSNRLAMASAGGETQIKMRIAENLKGKRIIMVPGSDSSSNGMNIKTFDVNDFLRNAGLMNYSVKK